MISKKQAVNCWASSPAHYCLTDTCWVYVTYKTLYQLGIFPQLRNWNCWPSVQMWRDTCFFSNTSNANTMCINAHMAWKKVMEVRLYPVPPISQTLILSLTVLILITACPSEKILLRRRWVWSTGGMILTGEDRSTGRETLYSVGGRWMNGYGALVEWYWQGKTEVLREKHYTAWVVGEWMGMEHWWNDTDRGKLKCWERNIIQRGL